MLIIHSHFLFYFDSKVKTLRVDKYNDGFTITPVGDSSSEDYIPNEVPLSVDQ